MYYTLPNRLNALGEQVCASAGTFTFTKEMELFTSLAYDNHNAFVLFQINSNTGMSNCPGVELLEIPGFDVVEPLIGVDPDTFTSNYGYMLYSTTKRMAVFSLRGTSSVAQWSANANAKQVPPSGVRGADGLVHQGIHTIYTGLLPSVEKLLTEYADRIDPLQLVFTGHSLGGALALLFGMNFSNLNPQVYTTGAPRVGDPIFALSIGVVLPSLHRISNNSDIVPWLPFPIWVHHTLYNHPPEVAAVGFINNQGSYAKNHFNSYRDYLDENS